MGLKPMNEWTCRKSEFIIINKTVQCFSMKPNLIHQGLLIHVDSEEHHFKVHISFVFISASWQSLQRRKNGCLSVFSTGHSLKEEEEGNMSMSSAFKVSVGSEYHSYRPQYLITASPRQLTGLKSADRFLQNWQASTEFSSRWVWQGKKSVAK